MIRIDNKKILSIVDKDTSKTALLLSVANYFTLKVLSDRMFRNEMKHSYGINNYIGKSNSQLRPFINEYDDTLDTFAVVVVEGNSTTYIIVSDLYVATELAQSIEDEVLRNTKVPLLLSIKDSKK